MLKECKEAEGLLWRVEPICKALIEQRGTEISPSGYYAYKNRRPSKRELHDSQLKELILDIRESNCCCWGAKKAWHALLRDGEKVARCTVERLMRELGVGKGQLEPQARDGCISTTIPTFPNKMIGIGQ